ncbi:MAG: hypothetical protein LBF72_02015 [Holosporales bacterium]|nr:hypothetical protein [Holosporales bacterium]
MNRDIPSHRKFASRRHVAQKRSVLMVREHSNNVGLQAKSQTLLGLHSTNSQSFDDWVYTLFPKAFRTC